MHCIQNITQKTNQFRDIFKHEMVTLFLQLEQLEIRPTITLTPLTIIMIWTKK